MEYQELHVDTIVEYLKNIEEIRHYFGIDEELAVEEIGDGNLNYVYIVRAQEDINKALVVKQAVPYLRIVGEDFPLGRERMTYEIRALQEFKKLALSFVPKIYYASEEMSLVVMEYLGKHRILRGGLLDAHKYAHLSNHIATYLANTLFFSSSLHLSSTQKRSLIEQFNSNTELCKLTEDFVFTFAFMENETNDNENVGHNENAQELFGDMEFKANVMELKYKFMTATDALIHGDLHTGSIMLNDEETYVIDPEFAFVGPFGFDIGAIIANLVNNYIHHSIVTLNEEYKNYLLQMIEEIYEMFVEKFIALWDTQKNSALILDGFVDEKTLKNFKEAFLENIVRESIGYAGCKIARRVFGVAGVEDIRGIKNANLRHEAEGMALRIARAFVMNYKQVSSIDEVIKMIENAR